MQSFQSILSKKVDDIEAPKVPPVGGYICTVSGPAVPNERSQFLIMDIPFAINSAMDDVDPDSLAEFGNVAGTTIRHSFLFNKEDANEVARTEYNLRTFLSDHLGIDCTGKSLGEALSEIQGQRCVVYVRHDPDKNDPNRVYLRVRATAPLD